MQLIVKDVGQITVSDEIQKQLDIPGLMQSLKHDFNKLDDLKKTRQKHEARNSLMRWWHSDEIEDAQLDALQLHGELSKKLSQLMLISIAMSRTLNTQQDKLQQQQTRIQEQTSEIAQANETIQQQQEQLAEQQAELETLIRNYFELKGLTADGAKKLIEIAEDVQDTKAQLTLAFDDALLAAVNDIDARSEQIVSQFKQLADQFNHLDAKVEQLDAKVEHQLAQQETQIDTRLQEQSNELVAIREQMEQQLQQTTALHQKQLGRLRWMVAASLLASAGTAAWVVTMGM